MTISEAQLIQQAVAPRVTLQDVEESVARESYTVLPDSTTTVCQLTLQNGWTVTGESACASPANYKKETGETLARASAVSKIWGFLGFLLKTKLSLIEKAGKPTGTILSLGSPVTYVGTKVVHAVPMTRGEYNVLRGWQTPAMEDPESLGYLVQYADGGQTNVAGFSGYISWSPRDVFEKAYDVPVRQKPETFLDRLSAETLELGEKLQKLSAFMTTAGYRNLAIEDQDDLAAQIETMRAYHKILFRRLKRLS